MPLAQMHKGPLTRIGNAMAKNFVGDRGNISLAKNQKSEYLCDRVAFGPFEIHVWQSPGDVPYVNQDSGNCVGNSGTGSAQDLILADTDARDPQRSFEVRRIYPVNFQKE